MKALFSSLAILMMAYFIPTQSETFTLKGKVTEAETGAPLMFANIFIKGTAIGTSTDLDGTFSLEVRNRCEELVFSYTGYETITKKVCEGDSVEIKMKAGAVQMSEVAIVKKEREKKRMSDKIRLFSAAPKAAMDMSNAYYSPGVVAHHDTYQEHNTEDYDHIKENRFYKVTETPLSTFSIDVDAAAYSNLRRFINNGQTPPADAVRIEEAHQRRPVQGRDKASGLKRFNRYGPARCSCQY